MNINTNFASLITQTSLKNSSIKLDESIKQMTSGFKINAAKDNAANFGIVTNMNSKISAYQIAEDNASMGLDMVETASSSLSLMSDLGSKLRSLCTQALNGTYGAKSLDAINSEAFSIVEEIQRLSRTTMYNGINLWAASAKIDSITSDITARTEYNNFVENPFDYSDAELASMTTLSSISDNTTISTGKYSISTPEELAKLALMTNSGKIKGGEFVLTTDIDLSGYSAGFGWTPIGDENNPFQAIFNGNGHKISNLYMKYDNLTDYIGLFGYINNGTLKNTGIIDCDIYADYYDVGGLVGQIVDSTITNCYATGKVEDVSGNVGGLIGMANSSSISSCYASSDVSTSMVGSGGLIGVATGCSVSNSFATGKVYGDSNVGGLIGVEDSSSINRCYSTADASGYEDVGGFVGSVSKNSNISNSYATGKVKANTGAFGNFVGYVHSDAGKTFSNCGVASSDINMIGGVKDNRGTALSDFDMSIWSDGIDVVPMSSAPSAAITDIILQVGINSSLSSQIGFDISFDTTLFDNLSSLKMDSQNSLQTIDDFIGAIDKKQTELGAVQNRLESVLEEISIQYENLVSSRSTLRDADIAKVSSDYIKYEILQQASATLMSTANHAPSIALQLL